MITYRVGDVVQVVRDNGGMGRSIGLIGKITDIDLDPYEGYPYEIDYDGEFTFAYNEIELYAPNSTKAGGSGTVQINIEPEQSELDKKFKGIIDRKFYKKT
ncbi:hypothetical protein KBA63_00685 [Candidatus Woesebacteria bacterium]|nr:hypothetical protein [Candidatus Woesebacteria bacterium]